MMNTTKQSLRLASAYAALVASSTAAFAAPADDTPTRTDTIVVTAPRAESKARETQKLAPNLVNVQSAEAIAKYPDFNAAEALGRIPGISLSSDTGEGRFVNIRGIDGNLNGATYGGVVLLNTNPGGTVFGSGRAVEFDTIPTGAIDGLIVTKTGMPNHDAEGLGGSIELTPRSAALIDRPFVEGALGYGYEPAHKHGGPFNADIAVGARFGGGDRPFSFVLTASRREDRRGFDDIEADYVDDDTLTAVSPPALSALQVNKALANIQLRRYDYHRRRFGYGGEFAYTPNADHQYYIRAAIAGYVESVIKNRLTYDKLDQALKVDPARPAGFSTLTNITVKGTDEEETHRNQVYVVGGRDRFGSLKLDYHVAYSRATFDVGRNYGTTFTGPKKVPFVYDNITDADFPAFAITNTVDANNGALYTLTKLSNSTTRSADSEWSYAANAAVDLHLIGDNDRLQFGAQLRQREKDNTPFAQSFGGYPATLLSNASNGVVTNFYGGRYTNGTQIASGTIRGLASSATTAGLVADLTGYFRATEDIYAGYLMYSADSGPFGFVAGARVEKTRARYSSYSFDQNDMNLGLATRKRDYTNVFPTVQLRYELTPQVIARATYSTGIGRPGFSQVASAVTIDADNNIITTGNPNLQPTTGNSFDVALEWYLPHSGIVSVGLFDKQLDNYVVQRTRKGTDALGRLPGIVTFNTYDNVPSSYARGIEAAYVQRFASLPAPFDGLGVDLNGTYVDSLVTLRSGERRRLPATSEFTGNAALFYEAHGVQLRLSAQYVGSNLFGIGGSAASDIYQNARTTVDFTSAYDLTSHFRIYLNIKNLTNEPYRIYEGTSSRPIQREFYDETYEAGVKFKF